MNFSNNAGERVSAEQRLTTDGQFKKHPVFWPGGRELIYTVLTPVTQVVSELGVNQRDGCARLVRLKVADRSVAFFHEVGHGVTDRELSVSADGTMYAYCLLFRNFNLDWIVIVVEDRQRGRKVTIGGHVPFSLLTRPSLSPDGNRIVFVRDSKRLVALDLKWKDGAEVVDLSKSDANAVELGVPGDLQPSFSPDGRRIVFTSRRDRDYEIYVMNADGSEQRRLTHSRGIDMNPVFSPDGRRIAYTSNRDGNYEIYVMDADGRNPQRVTRHPERSDFPCWHPDGKHVVFVGERNGRFDLYMVEAPG
jgi:Tol biopolymer transport system component